MTFFGCSSFRKAGVGIAGDLIYRSSHNLQREFDWNFLKVSMPGLIKYSESLLEIDEDNEDLKITLLKGYSSYAFVVWDTLFLEDSIKE